MGLFDNCWFAGRTDVDVASGGENAVSTPDAERFGFKTVENKYEVHGKRG